MTQASANDGQAKQDKPAPAPACPRCGAPADLGACSSGACKNCGFRPSCSMG